VGIGLGVNSTVGVSIVLQELLAVIFEGLTSSEAVRFAGELKLGARLASVRVRFVFKDDIPIGLKA
jgi:hypothetical protein